MQERTCDNSSDKSNTGKQYFYQQEQFLFTRSFTLLLLGQGLTNFAFYCYTILLLTWTFILTNSSTAVTGTVIATTLPACLLGPLAGVFVDRWNRQIIMVVATLILACGTLLPLFAPAQARLLFIYISVGIISASSCVFMPANSGILQLLTTSQRQGQAAFISKALFTGGAVVGGAMASPLYFTLGPRITCLIAMVCFLGAAGCLLAIRMPAATNATRHVDASPHLLQSLHAVEQELLTGLRFIVQTRVLFVLLLAVCLETFGTSVANALNIVFITRHLHADASLYGSFNAGIGIATVVGMIVVGPLMRWIAPKYLFCGAILILGLGLIMYALQTAYMPALIILSVVCFPQSGIDVGLGPMLLAATPTHLIGRVQSVIETFLLAMTLLTLALSDYIGHFLPINEIFLLAGGITTVGGVLAFLGLYK